MKHVKQSKLDSFIDLVKKYHNTLDLISNKGLETLDLKIQEAMIYVTGINQDSPFEKTILDIGSGMGLPGIVLAIALPDFEITLSERRQKRATFLQITKSTLELTNVNVFKGDIQHMPNGEYRYITALAVGSFSYLYSVSKHLHAPKITFLSRKGENWLEEVDELEHSCNMPVNAEKVADLSSHGSLVRLDAPGGMFCR